MATAAKAVNAVTAVCAADPGLVSLRDLLQARLHDLDEESVRERHLLPLRSRRAVDRAPVGSAPPAPAAAER